MRFLWIGPKGQGWGVFATLCREGRHQITHCADGQDAENQLQAMIGGIDGIILAGTDAVPMEGDAADLRALRAMGENVPVFCWHDRELCPCGRTQRASRLPSRRKRLPEDGRLDLVGGTPWRKQTKPWVVLEYHAPCTPPAKCSEG